MYLANYFSEFDELVLLSARCVRDTATSASLPFVNMTRLPCIRDCAKTKWPSGLLKAVFGKKQVAVLALASDVLWTGNSIIQILIEVIQ